MGLTWEKNMKMLNRRCHMFHPVASLCNNNLCRLDVTFDAASVQQMLHQTLHSFEQRLSNNKLNLKNIHT